jgi:hypothetical protein
MSLSILVHGDVALCVSAHDLLAILIDPNSSPSSRLFTSRTVSLPRQDVKASLIVTYNEGRLFTSHGIAATSRKSHIA